MHQDFGAYLSVDALAPAGHFRYSFLHLYVNAVIIIRIIITVFILSEVSEVLKCICTQYYWWLWYFYAIYVTVTSVTIWIWDHTFILLLLFCCCVQNLYFSHNHLSITATAGRITCTIIVDTVFVPLLLFSTIKLLDQHLLFLAWNHSG